ncbi:MAG: hypothetical protein IPG93_03505 [Burkholderiales bacterium]|nr:hypothetical protein [Burkholderiales bacterium]
MQHISNEDLVLQNIPGPEAGWIEILDFALTFDGYEYWGSFERCAEVAAAKAHGNLTGLRTCLFFEQRLWRNGTELPPNMSTLKRWRSLINKIRKQVQDKPDS